ncbi:MAG TPA: hydroxyphenylacetyl-CoA thioesterase PaaI [Woeseiaceae bacterium]
MTDQTMIASELARDCRDRMLSRDAATRSLGITVEVNEPGNATAQLEVTPSMINGFGVCHGGYLFALADTAFAFACNSYDRVTFAAGAAIEFLRPVKVGDRLVAEARERHRGRTQGLYDVTVRDQDGSVVALFRGRSHATKRPLLQTD